MDLNDAEREREPSEDIDEVPPGVITAGATSLPPGWNQKLSGMHRQLSPLVRSGAIAGFFLGDEQCANGTCIERQLGPVAARLHALFDPDGDIVVYSNEATKVCDPRRGNTSWVLPASIDLFSEPPCTVVAGSRRWRP